MNTESISAAWFNSLSEEQKKTVLSEGLGNRLLHEGLSYAVPIWMTSFALREIAAAGRQ